MIKLRPLPPGGTIGIMAPSSPVDEEKLQNGVSYLEKIGYRVYTTPGCRAREHYLAGSPAKRAAELMELVSDDRVDAVFFARGGFGSLAMLPLLDYRTIRASRKLMVGFSDITALQWGIYAKTGMPSLSGGMPAVDFARQPVNPRFEETFWKFIETGIMDCELPSSSIRIGGGSKTVDSDPITHQHNTYLKSPSDGSEPEIIRGIALPGTLSVAIRLAGTPWAPDFRNAIPVFEDVAESRHKIEGSLMQARLSGWLDPCRAIIFGDFAAPEKETFPDNPTLGQIIDRVLENIDIPILTGMPYGHIDHKIPVTVGHEISLSLGNSVKVSSTDTLFAH